MDLVPITKKRSLGKLREAPKTKAKSPEMTGTLRLQRHTAAAILRAFEDSDCAEIICNIAAWVNRDDDGRYLTIEISPKYASRESQSPKSNSLDFIFNGEESRN